MKDVSKSGRTVLFVSHSMMAIQSLCSAGLVLKQGTVIESGDLTRCVGAYLAEGGTASGATWERKNNPEKSPLFFRRVSGAVEGCAPNQRLDLDIELKSIRPHQKAFLAADIYDPTSTCVMQALPTLEPFIPESPDGYRTRLSIKLPPLVPGLYSVTLWVGSHNTNTFDEIPQAVAFEIVDSPTAGRSFPHSRDHGFMVPESTVAQLEQSK